MSQPRNAESLVAMRNARNVPALPILVSFAGALDFTNLTLQAKTADAYDWRCLSGLEVELFVSMSDPFSDVLAQLAAIAAVVPKQMTLTFAEGPRIDCGQSRLVCHEDGDFALFDWFPMAVGPKFYAEATTIVRRIWAQLGKVLPIPFDRAMDLIYEIAKEKQQCA